MLAMTMPLSFHTGPNYLRPSDKIESLARKILKDDPRDLTTRSFLAGMIASDNRPAEAIAEYERVLDVAPEHLLARLQLAEQLRQIEPAVAVAEFSKLIENPRFEEIFPLQPAAIRAFHFVATDLMKQGRIAEALEVAQRSLVHVNRSRSLRNETFQAHSQAGSEFSLFADGETYYLIARIHAAAVAQDHKRLGAVLDNLERAFAIHPKFRNVWFAKDRRFDGLRAEINREMNPDVVDR
jgi:tetratricopeptide (TPR) repeat protein